MAVGNNAELVVYGGQVQEVNPPPVERVAAERRKDVVPMVIVVHPELGWVPVTVHTNEPGPLVATVSLVSTAYRSVMAVP